MLKIHAIYMYICLSKCLHTMAIFNRRRGIRMNNAELVEVGRYKRAPIFHGRNHLKYQVIEITEDVNSAAAPPPAQAGTHQKDNFHVHQCISFERRGRRFPDGKGQSEE